MSCWCGSAVGRLLSPIKGSWMPGRGSYASMVERATALGACVEGYEGIAFRAVFLCLPFCLHLALIIFFPFLFCFWPTLFSL